MIAFSVKFIWLNIYQFQSSDRVNICIHIYCFFKASLDVKCTSGHFTMICVRQCRFVDIKITINISFHMYQNKMLYNGTYWIVEIIKIVAFNVR